MSDKQRLLQLVDAIPDEKLAQVVEMLEALVDYWKMQTISNNRDNCDS